jgi:hypothetical protein
MDSSAYSKGDKYCHNGDMAFAHHPVGLPGVQDGDDGPFAAPLEKVGLQGTSFGVRDPRPLGPGWTLCLASSFLIAKKYCHNGA